MELRRDGFKKRPLWIIRGGTGEQAHDSFVSGCISLGWSRIKDLRLIAANRKAFRKEYRRHYRDDSPGAARMRASELYRFLNKVEVGDFIVYPSRKKDGLVHVGRVMGGYKFKPGRSPHHHLRKVKWIKEMQWSELSPRVRRTLDCRPSLYRPKRYANDVREALLP
jgi:restriction system protein